MIDKQTQDQAWSSLPPVIRKGMRQDYKYTRAKVDLNEVSKVLSHYFGDHNLTSDAEPEEMLSISRAKVIGVYAYNDDILRLDPMHQGAKLLKNMLESLFGSKCLPDEPLQTYVKVEESSVKVKPKFNVGDMVVFKCSDGDVAQTIHSCKFTMGYWFYNFAEGGTYFDEYFLKPYTEPTQTNDNMEEKEHRNLYRKIPQIAIKGCVNSNTTKELYNALCTLESASVAVRKALIKFSNENQQ